MNLRLGMNRIEVELQKKSDFIAKLKKKHKMAKLPNTITIDSIYEKKFLSLSSVIEAVILSFQVLY
ncbi:hypothetical protein ACS0TY_013399 [Phlomoides rotata]